MAYDTERWTYVPAKFIGEYRTRGAVRVLVVHTGQIKESTTSAEALARYGQNPDPGTKPSWHVAVDSDSVVQCVYDSYVANAAPGCNHDGIQMELACYAEQTASQWRDPYSIALIAQAADVAAQYCLKFDLPVRRLTVEQLLAGERGIVGHDTVTLAYKRSDHMDPGPNFPWKRFIALTAVMVEERRLIA
jgi:N-acetylmuramoyl-L-alanine amidase CwlA